MRSSELFECQSNDGHVGQAHGNEIGVVFQSDRAYEATNGAVRPLRLVVEHVVVDKVSHLVYHHMFHSGW